MEEGKLGGGLSPWKILAGLEDREWTYIRGKEGNQHRADINIHYLEACPPPHFWGGVSTRGSVPFSWAPALALLRAESKGKGGGSRFTTDEPIHFVIYCQSLASRLPASFSATVGIPFFRRIRPRVHPRTKLYEFYPHPTSLRRPLPLNLEIYDLIPPPKTSHRSSCSNRSVSFFFFFFYHRARDATSPRLSSIRGKKLPHLWYR